MLSIFQMLGDACLVYLPRWEWWHNLVINNYSPLFPEPEANNCFSIIFRGKYQGLQNNGLTHKNRDAIARVHTCMQPYM